MHASARSWLSVELRFESASRCLSITISSFATCIWSSLSLASMGASWCHVPTATLVACSLQGCLVVWSLDRLLVGCSSRGSVRFGVGRCGSLTCMHAV